MPSTLKPFRSALLLSGCALCAWPALAAPQKPAPAPKADSRLLTYDTCVNVLEGDLIECKKVGQIRLVGVIAPTAGEAGYRDALAYTKRLVMGKQVKIDICSERPNDYKDRLRAIVYLPDSTNLNTKLLRAGVVRVLDRKPCHVDAGAWNAYEAEARKAKLGVWGGAGSGPTGAGPAPAPSASSHRRASGAHTRRTPAAGSVRIRPKR